MKTEKDATTTPLRRIKVITLGSNASGKSCLIKRFCEERFVSKYIPTIGVDYGVKAVKVRDTQIRVNFWVRSLLKFITPVYFTSYLYL